MQTFQLQIPFMRGFRRSKSAFADATTVRHYLHQPFTLMRAYAQKARRIGFSWAAHVLQVAKTVNLAQVCKTVVLFVTEEITVLFGIQVPVTCRPTSSWVKAAVAEVIVEELAVVTRSATERAALLVLMNKKLPE